MFRKIVDAVAAEAHLERHDAQIAKHYRDGGTVKVISPNGDERIETEPVYSSGLFRRASGQNKK
jgi:hypothetical protein